MSSASIKNVKKEEVDDDEDDNFLSSLAQRKKKNQSNGHGDVRSKTLKVKKEELEDDEDEKPIIKKIPNKGDKDKKKKNKRREEERGDKANRQKHKEKKVYNLPGQKHDPPEERDPLRIFYESLHEQISSSEMAAFWMMERGLLPLLEAKKVYEKKLKKNNANRLNSPNKSASIKKTPPLPSDKKNSSSKSVSTTNKKHKAAESSDSDDDFIVAKKKVKRC